MHIKPLKRVQNEYGMQKSAYTNGTDATGLQLHKFIEPCKNLDKSTLLRPLKNH